MDTQPKISFVTTCMGRLQHLKQTLPQNIRDCSDYPNAQFVVLNYGDEADTAQWIKDNFQKEMDSGLLKYVAYPEATYFEYAHAKNMAHRMADGEILCNVDADQYLGKGFPQYLEETFGQARERGRKIFLRHGSLELSANDALDSIGKLALLKSDFDRFRGYNENISSWGGEDTDLIARLMSRLIHKMTIPLHFAHGITHPDSMRLERLSETDQLESARKIERVRARGDSRCLDVVGKTRSLGMHLLKAIDSNVNGEGFGAGTVYVNFSETPVQIPSFPESNRQEGLPASRDGINEVVSYHR